MCLRPLHYFESDLTDENGKKYGFITGYQTKIADYNIFLAHKTPCTLAYRCKPIVVPCGKCAECKQMIRNRWVGRCVAQMEVSNFAYFITLTYNDDCLRDCNKAEIQRFIKRLRKYIKCSYLAVGEYGSATNRPHYHLILFTDEPLQDLMILKKNKNFYLYRSAVIEKCWSFGLSSVGMASASSIAYTIGYLVKKDKKTAFKLQSNGLGAEFFKELKEKYYLSNGLGCELIVYLPRYLRKKYGIEFSFDKEISELRFKNALFNSGLDEYSYRNFKEYLAESKLIV